MSVQKSNQLSVALFSIFISKETFFPFSVVSTHADRAPALGFMLTC